MTHITSMRQQPDGSALHAVESDDGERWVIRSVPWYSETGVEIGVQWFLTERDTTAATVEDAELVALALVEGEYRPSPTLSGPSAT